MSTLSALASLFQEYWYCAPPAILIVYLFSNWYQNGLNKVPGPLLHSISTLPRMWSVYKGDHHLEDLRLHARYGKVVRLAPNLVSVSDVEEVNQIYGINTKFTKSPFYDLSAVHDEEGLVPDPFVIRHDKALHARMKRNAANAYSMNGLLKFEPLLVSVIDRLLVVLDQHVEAESVCDLGDMLKRFAMDAVCSMTFGRDFSYMEKGDHYGFFPTLDLFTTYMAVFGHVAWLHPYLLGNPRLAQYVTRNDNSSNAMLDIAANELQKARDNPPDEEATMTFMERLCLNQAANPKSITDREIITHAFGNISAGSDTTAIAMRAVVYYTLKTPGVYNRLCGEVRENLQLPVSFTQAYELPYLRAVVQEAMRMHPSVGQILGRTVPSGGATIGGYYVAAGAEVGISPWVVHRNPRVFRDPEAFIPERWLPGKGGSTEDELRDMNRSFFAFGHGTHTCTGRHISMMEMIKVIATLLLKYDLEFVETGEGYRFMNRWFSPQEGLNVTLRRRGS